MEWNIWMSVLIIGLFSVIAVISLIYSEISIEETRERYLREAEELEALKQEKRVSRSAKKPGQKQTVDTSTSSSNTKVIGWSGDGTLKVAPDWDKPAQRLNSENRKEVSKEKLSFSKNMRHRDTETPKTHTTSGSVIGGGK